MRLCSKYIKERRNMKVTFCCRCCGGIVNPHCFLLGGTGHTSPEAAKFTDEYEAFVEDFCASNKASTATRP